MILSSKLNILPPPQRHLSLRSPLPSRLPEFRAPRLLALSKSFRDSERGMTRGGHFHLLRPLDNNKRKGFTVNCCGSQG